MKTQFPTFTLLRYICPDIVRDKSICSSSRHITCKVQSETDLFHQTVFLHKPHRNALDCRQYACTQNDRRASELLPKPCLLATILCKVVGVPEIIFCNGPLIPKGRYLSHLPEAPQGKISPHSVTGSPISCESMRPPYFLSSVDIIYVNTAGASPVV